ncbi:low temperature requirement protein A [Streptomyces sp. NPDC057137]|uniref:low temperature requirement protein A n=1 Tax=Streptomyces sp. NPDC057137 TaxID=3346030 RepID=UPI00362DFA44
MLGDVQRVNASVAVITGAAQTMVLLLAAWWAWTSTAWFTNFFDPERPPVRLVLIALTPADHRPAPEFGSPGPGPLPGRTSRSSRQWVGIAAFSAVDKAGRILLRRRLRTGQ